MLALKRLSVLWFWSLLPPRWLWQTGFKPRKWTQPWTRYLVRRQKFDTVKVGKEMSQELKQYLRQKEQLCLWGGVLYWCGGWAWWDHNELQLVVPPEYRLEAMWGAYDNEGHLGLERMFDILCDRFYWPKPEADATCHVHPCEQCLRFKCKQDKAELYPLLVTYPLELLHMDFWQ